MLKVVALLTVGAAGPMIIGSFSGGTIAGNTSFGGTVTSTRTTDIGWSLRTGANTACNTTCTSACVLGWDTTSGEVGVACTDATADKCLCAGSS